MRKRVNEENKWQWRGESERESREKTEKWESGNKKRRRTMGDELKLKGESEGEGGEEKKGGGKSKQIAGRLYFNYEYLYQAMSC